MKRKRKPRPTQLIITARLIYEPNHELIWDRRTYYDSRPICFGLLLSKEDYLECPRELLDEWAQLIQWQMDQVLARLTGKET